MSVDPVHGSSPAIERPTPEPKQHAVPASRVADSGTNAAASNHPAEIAKPASLPAPLLIPEHEVKVILDTRVNNTLVYQVLDKQSGDVVLQVPPAEQLRAMHESQELLQRIAARGKGRAADEIPVPPSQKKGK